MRGLLIDPDTRTVSHYDMPIWSLDEIHCALTRPGGRPVDTIDKLAISPHSVCWLDDDGHNRLGTPVWRFIGAGDGWLAGRGLILGVDARTGASCSTLMMRYTAIARVMWSDLVAGGVQAIPTATGVALRATPVDPRRGRAA